MSEADDSQKQEDQEGKKVVVTDEQIKRAIWIHNQLIERFPDIYRILRRIYTERK